MKTLQTADKAPRLFRAFVIALLVGVTLALAVTGWRAYALYESVTDSGPDDPAIGHLSGVPVQIPPGFGWFLEYEKAASEPGIFELYPDRTYASGITGFGFEAEYPSMRPVFGTRDDRSVYESMRLHVGVGAGSAYGKPLWLDRLTYSPISRPVRMYQGVYHYSKIPQLTHGLVGYELPGVPSEFRVPFKVTVADDNVYYVADEDGHVTTLIKCSNARHAAAPCTQTFSLEPAVKAEVRVIYRIGLLRHWQEIQQAVSQVVLGFRTSNPTTAEGAQR